MTTILISLLSGAIGGSLLTALFNYLTEKSKRKVAYLRKQVDNFYGPLYCIITTSEAAFKQSKEIIDATGKAHFATPDEKKTERRQEVDRKKISNDIEVANEYGDYAIKNNEKIFEIISNKYSYIDLDDIEVVDDFLRNYLRLVIEYQHRRQLSLEVETTLGSIHGLQSGFVKKMKEKFNLKKHELMENSCLTNILDKLKKLFC